MRISRNARFAGTVGIWSSHARLSLTAFHPSRTLTGVDPWLSVLCMRATLVFLAGALIPLSAACSERQARAPQSVPDTAPAATSVFREFPALTGRVVDAAQILAPEQERALSGKLAALEAGTAHQLVIVTVPTLRGQDIGIFARDLGRHWGIGRRDYNDGIVLLVALKVRKVRIAVGYGLENTLTDAVCAEIIADRTLPKFRQGDVPGGIEAATDALIARLN